MAVAYRETGDLEESDKYWQKVENI
jgi:hypothetical protein